MDGLALLHICPYTALNGHGHLLKRVVISKYRSRAEATAQPVENTEPLYEVYQKKHYMECTISQSANDYRLHSLASCSTPPWRHPVVFPFRQLPIPSAPPHSEIPYDLPPT